MKGSYLNDGFFSRLETLSLNLKTSLSGYFGGKHLVLINRDATPYDSIADLVINDTFANVFPYLHV